MSTRSSKPTELDYLSELEELGEEILMARREIVDMDRRRNQNREALRALIQSPKQQKKTWLTIGSLLVKVPVDRAKETLQKEQVVLDAEINKLRTKVKDQVNRLQDLEHKPPIGGLMLNPLNKTELTAVQQVMGK